MARTFRTAPLKTGVLISELLACTRLLLLQLCSLEYGLGACGSAAVLVSTETRELFARSLAMFCGA